MHRSTHQLCQLPGGPVLLLQCLGALQLRGYLQERQQCPRHAIIDSLTHAQLVAACRQAWGQHSSYPTSASPGTMSAAACRSAMAMLCCPSACVQGM